MSSTSELTIVLCTVGNLEHLERALASVDRERRPTDQVLIIDREDKAPVRQLAERHAARYLHQSGRGISAARNTGIDATTTPFLAFLDDDCEALPGWRDAVSAAIARGVQLASGPVDGPRKNLPMRWAYHAYRDPDHRSWKLVGCNMLIRTAVAAQVRFDEAFTFGFDETDFERRAVKLGLVASRTNGAVYHHHRATWSDLWVQQTRYAPRAIHYRRKHGDFPPVPVKFLLLCLFLASLVTIPWLPWLPMAFATIVLAALTVEAIRIARSVPEGLRLLPVTAFVAVAQWWGTLTKAEK
jgi:GT2 family glycosyltransferase